MKRSNKNAEDGVPQGLNAMLCDVASDSINHMLQHTLIAGAKLAQVGGGFSIVEGLKEPEGEKVASVIAFHCAPDGVPQSLMDELTRLFEGMIQDTKNDPSVRIVSEGREGL